MKSPLAVIPFVLLAMSAAHAQIVPPPPAVPSQPPPAAPPPPPITVPQVPQMDAPPQAPKAPPARRSSYHDRVLACLDDPYSVRLTPGERVAYSRNCANRPE